MNDAADAAAATVNQSVEFGTVRDAVAVGMARGRLYRAAMRLVDTYAVRALPNGRAPRGRSVTVSPDEHLVVTRLKAELEHSYRASGSLLGLEEAAEAFSAGAALTPYAGTCLAACEAARGAWDLLAVHRDAADVVGLASGQAVRTQDSARTILADAATVIHGLSLSQPKLAEALLRVTATDLRSAHAIHREGGAGTFLNQAAAMTEGLAVNSRHLTPPLLTAAGAYLTQACHDAGLRPGHGARVAALMDLAADCLPQRASLAVAARAVFRRLAGAPRGALDALTPGPPPLGHPPSVSEAATPDGLPQAVAVYRNWALQNANALTVDDLVNLAGVASRLTGLTGVVHGEIYASSYRAVQGWRTCRTALSQIASLRRAPAGRERAARLAAGLDRILSEVKDPATDREQWKEPTAESIRHIPDLIIATEHALFENRLSGNIATPTGLFEIPRAGVHRPGQWRIPTQDDDRIAMIREALHVASDATVRDVIPSLPGRAPPASTPPFTPAQLAALLGPAATTPPPTSSQNPTRPSGPPHIVPRSGQVRRRR